MKKPIVILDGPAGAGKSYAIRKLVERGWYDAKDIGSTSRNEIGTAGQMQQANRNLSATVDVVRAMSSEEDYKGYVIDRGPLSNTVYTRLSGDNYRPDTVTNLKRCLYNFNVAVRILTFTTAPNDEAVLSKLCLYPINYFILLPEFDTIAENREKSDKAYPFLIGYELSMWSAVISECAGLFEDLINVEAFQQSADKFVNFLEGYYG